MESVQNSSMLRTLVVKNQRMTVGCWTLANGPACIVLGLRGKLNIAMKSNADKLMLPVWQD